MAQPSKVGIAIARERARRGWTTRQLAEKVGVHHSHVSKLESGSIQFPNADITERFAAAFGMTSDELLGASRSTGTPPTASPFGPVVLIPLVNISLAAGQTVYGETRETVPVPSDIVAGKSLVAARIAGDCMEPEIMAGDVAIVDISDRTPRPGRLVAVLLEDGGMAVKRLDRDSEGPVLLDNKGGSYRPNGAKVQGTIVSVVRNYR